MTYLAAKLHCNPMRVTKKLRVGRPVGRQSFQPGGSAGDKQRAEDELAILENRFFASIPDAHTGWRAAGACSWGPATSAHMAVCATGEQQGPVVERSSSWGSGKPSKHRGVYWNKRCSKWTVQIRRSGKNVYLGSFVTEDEAAQAYATAERATQGSALSSTSRRPTWLPQGSTPLHAEIATQAYDTAERATQASAVCPPPLLTTPIARQMYDTAERATMLQDQAVHGGGVWWSGVKEDDVISLGHTDACSSLHTLSSFPPLPKTLLEHAAERYLVLRGLCSQAPGTSAMAALAAAAGGAGASYS
jgi:hypothetical protein